MTDWKQSELGDISIKVVSHQGTSLFSSHRQRTKKCVRIFVSNFAKIIQYESYFTGRTNVKNKIERFLSGKM